MQSVAEIRTMLQDWEREHPRLTPKTRQPSRKKPKWEHNLAMMEQHLDGPKTDPLPGVLVRCKCDCLHRVLPYQVTKRGLSCKGWRQRVNG